jgi:hypothetical protein
MARLAASAPGWRKLCGKRRGAPVSSTSASAAMRRRIRLALVGRMRTSVRCIPVAELLDPEPSVGIEEDLHHAVVREVGTDGTERANERVVSPNLTLGGRVAKRKGPLRPHSLAVNTRAVAVHNWQGVH